MKNKTALSLPPISNNITIDGSIILQNVTNMTSDHHKNTIHPNDDITTDYVPLVRDETQLEYISDFLLGVAFLIIGVIAAKRYVLSCVHWVVHSLCFVFLFFFFQKKDSHHGPIDHHNTTTTTTAWHGVEHREASKPTSSQPSTVSSSSPASSVPSGSSSPTHSSNPPTSHTP
jgi:hypothetical protein